MPHIIPQAWHDCFGARLKGSIGFSNNEGSAEITQLDHFQVKLSCKKYAQTSGQSCVILSSLSAGLFVSLSLPPLVLRPSLAVPSGLKAHSISWVLAVQRSAPRWCHWEFQAEAHFLLIKRHFSNSIHMVSLHFSSYSITPAPHLHTFPLPSCFSIRKDRYSTHGTRPKRHPQVSRTQSPLSGTFPQLQQLNIIRGTKKKRASSDCKAKDKKKKKKQRKKEQRKRRGRETASWKLCHKIFGATCSVYMTSCTVSHYLLSLDAKRLRPARRNGK